MKNISEESITINSTLADIIKDKFFDVYKLKYGRLKTANHSLAKTVETMLQEKYKLEKSYKTHTYHTTFHDGKPVKLSHDSLQLFILFCDYITNAANYTKVENLKDYKEPVVKKEPGHPLFDLSSKNIEEFSMRLLSDLTNFFTNDGKNLMVDEKIISEVKKQFKLWETDRVKYYACYYSKGHELPGSWLISVHKNWEKVELTEYEPTERTMEGQILKPQIGKNVFISFYDDRAQVYRLFSLRGNEKELNEMTIFKGHYSTGMEYDENDPVSGKVILEKVKDADGISKVKSNDIPSNLVQELLNEYLKIRNSSGNVDNEVLNNIKGVYRAYWFIPNADDVVVREMAVEILPTGLIKIRDYRADELTGFINLLDKDNKTLRCAFEPAKDGYNFRMQIILDVSHTQSKIYDGVFSGQTLGWREIIAGKIRLYRSSKQFLEINPKAVDYDEILKEFKQRGPELIDFFWGKSKIRDAFSNNYMLPNYAVFSHKIEEQKQITLPITKGDSRVMGNYILYRLDSSRRYINRYKLTINYNGTVEYILEGSKHLHHYKGVIKIQNYCLTIHMTHKDDETYEALYIFYFAGKSKDQYGFLGGVYSSIASDGGAALAGRAMLEPVDDFTEDLRQIEVFSEDYYKLQKDKPKNVVRLLTGFADNSIKPIRETDFFYWKIAYDQAFFNHACYHKALGKNQKRDYLIYAFEHGFADIRKLYHELQNPETLASINDMVKIINNIDEYRFKVTIELEKGTKTFEGRTMNKEGDE